MSPLFGGNNRKEKTIAILDIENGSVGAALARISRAHAPKLYGEIRIPIPYTYARNTAALMQRIGEALRQSLVHTSTVAARLRNHNFEDHGNISRIAVFLSPPWATMQINEGAVDFSRPIQEMVRHGATSMFGYKPVTFHPIGTAVAHGSAVLFPSGEPRILCIVSSEMSELLILSQQGVHGRGTIPVGLYTLLRTLTAHGGVSSGEAISFLKIAPTTSHELHEPLIHAQRHFASQFTDAFRELRAQVSPQEVLIIAPAPSEELFARALIEDDSLSDLFPDGGTVRALRPHHVSEFIGAHARQPDLHLMLETLFADAKFSGI
ncbi:MAG TPA: hypothetical protein VD928_01460 [Candidatus Paceibacterota bacterium]|nr:hypothetical protein [Candidatus Paceibacterota bacterium]